MVIAICEASAAAAKDAKAWSHKRITNYNAFAFDLFKDAILVLSIKYMRYRFIEIQLNNK